MALSDDVCVCVELEKHTDYDDGIYGTDESDAQTHPVYMFMYMRRDIDLTLRNNIIFCWKYASSLFPLFSLLQTAMLL